MKLSFPGGLGGWNLILVACTILSGSNWLREIVSQNQNLATDYIQSEVNKGRILWRVELYVPTLLLRKYRGMSGDRNVSPSVIWSRYDLEHLVRPQSALRTQPVQQFINLFIGSHPVKHAHFAS